MKTVFRVAALLPAVLLLMLCGCSGAGTSTAGAPASSGSSGSTADFSLAITPASVLLDAGSTGQAVTLAVTPLSGFASPVAVTLSGIPSGVTASSTTLSLTPGKPQAIMLTAAASAVSASKVILTASGVSGALSHTAVMTVSVQAQPPANGPDFSFVVAPSPVALQDGAAPRTITVSEQAVNGFTGAVSAQITGLPAGLTAVPAAFTLAPGSTQSVVLTATAATAGAASFTLSGISGSLSHTLAVPVTIEGAPAYVLSAAPAAQTLTIGNSAGAQVAMTAVPANGFSDPVTVTFTGLPTGVTASPASLVLTPGAAQNVTFAAGLTASAGSTIITVSGVDAAVAGASTIATHLTLNVQIAAVPDVTTYHYDNSRDGLNAQETILTPANVHSSTFGKVGFYAADGKVDAAPLFAAQVAINPTLTTNVVYVATEHDSVYAYDVSTGAALWQVSLLGAGETTARNGCSQITPETGITSTPVIDRSAGVNGTIFVVGMSVDGNGVYHQRLHALDLATGAEQPGSPSAITASYPGRGDNSINGNVVFDPAQYAERAALLLVHGTIYTAWTSHCDIRPYTGWVMGFSESTLQQTQVINLTPNGSEGSVWMAGNGMAADSNNNLYLLDANGSFQDTFNAFGFPSDGDYGNGILKLSTNGVLGVSDFFEPYNSDTESAGDVDLGSGGLLLLPDQIDGNGTTRHLLVGAGKDQNIYVADRDNLGKFNQRTLDNSNLYQELPNALARGAWSSPAYFNQTVYYAGQGDVLKAFPITRAVMAGTPSSRSATTFAYPGATPSVSANGTTNGIVWALESGTGSPAVLHAYDATNLANELYNSNQTEPNGSSSAFGNGNKFVTPVVVNGNVFVGTPNGVAVFGLLP